VGRGRPAFLNLDGRWYVSPDNGLLELVQRRSEVTPRWWDILWRPERMSETFHGRDLFAPVAARLARGETPMSEAEDYDDAPLARIQRLDWPDDLAEIIYIDGFGNAMAGIRAEKVPDDAEISVAGRAIRRTQKFSDVSEGELMWYENANGLLEISVNLGRADAMLNLTVGSQVRII